MLSEKLQILSRRVMSLPHELDMWIDRAAANDALEKNFSQIEALDYFMRKICAKNEDSLSALNINNDVERFLNSALDLTNNVIKSHVIWNFFRDRLELRFVPHFQQLLLMTDLVSHDCYTTIIDRAKALYIVPEHGFREYPITGLMADFSPATWTRGCRPKALWNHKLPVPVIDLPWDHLANPWELVTIAHEVGHDIDKDLGNLTKALRPFIASQLNASSISEEHIEQWQKWSEEILADLIGILLSGAAFVYVLAGLMTLPKYNVRYINSEASHPPHYLRTFINTAMLRYLGLRRLADTLETRWKRLYGEPGNDFKPYLAEIDPVIMTMLDTPVHVLRDQDGKLHTLNELITFTPDDQAKIQKAASNLAAGGSSVNLPIRHIVSASQLAFEQMIKANDNAGMDALAQRTRQAVIDMAPPGQLPAGLASKRTKQHLDDLVCAYINCSLDDIGIHLSAFKSGT